MTTQIARCIGLVAAVFLSSATPSPAQFEERQIGGVGITVFQDESFRGENATFRQDIPDLRQYGLNDRITSLRVAPREYWEACEETNYRGRCQVFSGEERNLRNIGWSDKISSLRRVRGGGGVGIRPPILPPIGKVGIVLYDEPLFRGRSVTIKDPTENLRFQSFHDRAESVRVLGGEWELCAEPRFRRCQTVDRDIARLSALGLNKKLSSARPVGSGSGGGPYPGGGGNARIILCGAVGGGQVECRTDGYATNVHLRRDLSNGLCRQGQSWGYTDSFIWANRGCRGEFEVTYDGGSGWGGGGSGSTRVISCGSTGAGNISCNPYGEIASARLIREESYRRCRQGATWGYTSDNLWTRDGCMGDFEVTYRGLRPQPR